MTAVLRLECDDPSRGSECLHEITGVLFIPLGAIVNLEWRGTMEDQRRRDTSITRAICHIKYRHVDANEYILPFVDAFPFNLSCGIRFLNNLARFRREHISIAVLRKHSVNVSQSVLDTNLALDASDGIFARRTSPKL